MFPSLLTKLLLKANQDLFFRFIYNITCKVHGQ